MLLESEELTKFIYNDDFQIYRKLLAYKLKIDAENFDTENVRYLKNEFKNSLIVRSTEVLNDLNINHIKKLNKFDNFDNQVSFPYLVAHSIDRTI